MIDGKADDSLLDTYEEERLPHAEDLVEWSVTFGNLMEHLAETEAAKRAGKENHLRPRKNKSQLDIVASTYTTSAIGSSYVLTKLAMMVQRVI